MAQHKLEVCHAWSVERSAFSFIVWSDLSLPTVVCAMVESDRLWQAASSFCEAVTVAKVKERVRKDDTSFQPICRRRMERQTIAENLSSPWAHWGRFGGIQLLLLGLQISCVRSACSPYERYCWEEPSQHFLTIIAYNGMDNENPF